MKKEIYVHIPEPCHENWEQMTPIQQGRFCQSCCKQVVDFSLMTDKQILEVLSKVAGNTCGRFSTDQLERPIVHQIPPLINPHKLFLSAFIPAFLLVNSNHANAQKGKVATKTVKTENIVVGMILPEITEEVEITGVVKDEKGQPIPGAAIVIKGTDKGVAIDVEGKFSLKSQIRDKQVLQVFSVGHQTKEIEIRKDQEMPIQIILSNNDMLTQGEVVVVAGLYETAGFDEEYDNLFTVKKITYNGLVVNEQGQPVPYASIKLSTKKGVMADSSGRFEFDAKPNKKRISLTASSVGYVPDATTIELSGEENTTIKIALKNNTALDEVVVKCTAESLTRMMGGLSFVRTVTIGDTANTFIQKVFKNEMFKAYPNPASKGSNVTLTFKKQGSYALQLFDNSGKLYIQKELLNQSSNQTISFALPAVMTSGMYYLKATNTSSSKQFIDKLTIQ